MSNLNVARARLLRQNNNKSSSIKSNAPIYGYSTKRCIPSSILLTSLKSIDSLPWNYDSNKQTKLLYADPFNLSNEKCEIAKACDPKSPMMKMNAFGFASTTLFFLDLVKQWQECELQGQTQSSSLPLLHNHLVNGLMIYMVGCMVNGEKKQLNHLNQQ